MERDRVKNDLPGERLPYEEEDAKPLPQRELKRYEAPVARAFHLAQDRSDIQFAVEELARTMSSPTRGSWKGLVKFGKYPKTHDRPRYRYPYQERPKELVVGTDTDFAGCKRTRKSTSGGVVM